MRLQVRAVRDCRSKRLCKTWGAEPGFPERWAGLTQTPRRSYSEENRRVRRRHL